MLQKLKWYIIGIATALFFGASTAYALSISLPTTIHKGDLLVGSSTNSSLYRLPTSTLGSVLWVNSSGLPAWTATSTLGISGGSSTPGGSTGQLQYNNTGSFGGIATGTAGTALFASSTSASGYEWKAVSGAGTVTSVDMTVPTGLAISGNPVTTIGTLALSLQAGYNIPLTASTTNWNNFYNTPSTRITAGNGLSWSGNTLSNVMASSTLTAGGVVTFSPNITFSTSTDTNLLLSIVCATSTCTFNPAWTGTLADNRISSAAAWNAKISQISLTAGPTISGASFTVASSSDTNLGVQVTAAGSTLTFAPQWIGTLAAGRLNSNVVQGFTNDTNVTATISAQNATLGWTGVLAVGRGGIGTTTLGSLTVSSSNLSITGGQQVLIGTSTQITLTANPTFTNLTASNASTTGLSASGYSWLTGVSTGNASTTGLSASGYSWLTGVSTGNASSTGLTVTGASFLQNASLSGTLNVTGQTTLGNASSTGLTVTGLSTLQNVTLSGTLSVTGKTTLANASSTSASFSSDIFDKNNNKVLGCVPRGFQLASVTPDSLTGATFSTATYTTASLINQPWATKMSNLYCKVDRGSVLLNFGGNLLSCTTSGASSTPSTAFGAESDVIAKIGTASSTVPNNLTVTATICNQ